jgi:hypothetical protein
MNAAGCNEGSRDSCVTDANGFDPADGANYANTGDGCNADPPCSTCELLYQYACAEDAQFCPADHPCGNDNLPCEVCFISIFAASRFYGFNCTATPRSLQGVCTLARH